MQTVLSQLRPKNITRTLIFFIAFFTINSSTMAQNIQRKDLLTAHTGNHAITRAEIKSVILAPAQKAGYHLHPCPVIGYIVSGTVLFQVEGEAPQTLHAGDAFYEPANQPVLHFDNASDSEPLHFIANYLINNETEIITMLPAKK